MATKPQKAWMTRVAELGCLVCLRLGFGKTPATIHHCGTKMGGGRNHKNVIPLCWFHHLGAEGIDGKRMGKRVWEAKYGTERELMQFRDLLLEVRQ